MIKPQQGDIIVTHNLNKTRSRNKLILCMRQTPNQPTSQPLSPPSPQPRKQLIKRGERKGETLYNLSASNHHYLMTSMISKVKSL